MIAIALTIFIWVLPYIVGQYIQIGGVDDNDNTIQLRKRRDTKFKMWCNGVLALFMALLLGIVACAAITIVYATYKIIEILI